MEFIPIIFVIILATVLTLGCVEPPDGGNGDGVGSNGIPSELLLLVIALLGILLLMIILDALGK